MGVCLSCHRRKRRGPEKHKVDHQLCQSVAPLHVCVSECKKVLSDRSVFSGQGDSEDRDSIDRASAVAPGGREGPARPHSAAGTHSASHSLLEPVLCYSSGGGVCNGTRKRLFTYKDEQCDSFNRVYNHDWCDSKQTLTLSNGHNIISISKNINKDHSYSGKCDSFSSDLINVKTSSGDSVTMANTISNMKMTNPIKGLVSKRRKRFIEDGFNLDLTYITDNLIAMGFPAEKLEGIYRNHIHDVARFLEEKHKDHYKIYNLCSERTYDTEKFQNRVAVYPFDDHNPPKIELIRPFCEDVHSWLVADQRNVAAVHCKAGKGRTGTMICCYMLHSGQFKTALEALNYYGQKRTHNRKGVTIPSQRRYVEYYAALLGMVANLGPTRETELYRPPALLILELLMLPPPALNGGQGTLEFCVSEANHTQRMSLGNHETRKGSSQIRIRLDRCTPLVGDIKVEVYNKPKLGTAKRLFHFWINTFFVTHEINATREDSSEQDGSSTYRLTLDKSQLDDAHKDKQNKMYSSDFKMEVVLQRVPAHSSWNARAGALRAGSPPSPPSPPSSAEEDTDDSQEPEEGWDSAVEGAEGGALLGHYRLLSEPELGGATSPVQPESPEMLQA